MKSFFKGRIVHLAKIDIGLALKSFLTASDRVRVTVNTPGGAREIFRAVRSGGSFGDSPFRLHIGLGQATSLKEVEIRWPAGTVQRWQNVAMEQTYRIREDAKNPVVIPLKQFTLTQEHKMAM